MLPMDGRSRRISGGLLPEGFVLVAEDLFELALEDLVESDEASGGGAELALVDRLAVDDEVVLHRVADALEKPMRLAAMS